MPSEEASSKDNYPEGNMPVEVQPSENSSLQSINLPTSSSEGSSAPVESHTKQAARAIFRPYELEGGNSSPYVNTRGEPMMPVLPELLQQQMWRINEVQVLDKIQLRNRHRQQKAFLLSKQQSELDAHLRMAQSGDTRHLDHHTVTHSDPNPLRTVSHEELLKILRTQIIQRKQQATVPKARHPGNIQDTSNALRKAISEPALKLRDKLKQKELTRKTQTINDSEVKAASSSFSQDTFETSGGGMSSSQERPHAFYPTNLYHTPSLPNNVARVPPTNYPLVSIMSVPNLPLPSFYSVPSSFSHFTGVHGLPLTSNSTEQLEDGQTGPPPRKYIRFHHHRRHHHRSEALDLSSGDTDGEEDSLARVDLGNHANSVNQDPLPRKHERYVAFSSTAVAVAGLSEESHCPCGHPNSRHQSSMDAIKVAMDRLHALDILQHVQVISRRFATAEELLTVHSPNHVSLCMSLLQEGVYHGAVKSCSTLQSTGSTIDLAMNVWKGVYSNGLSLVGPPGHLAYSNKCCGGSFINHLAVAAGVLIKRQKAKRILVVDWDILHGCGTQEIFYDEGKVLVVSIHRHDNGSFQHTGTVSEVGHGYGNGFNINIPWNECGDSTVGDPEYLAAFRSVVIPVASAFQPEIILVSAGFTAANMSGDVSEPSLYQVTPKCFGWMTFQLMSVCSRVVLVLEDGHHRSISRCIEETIKVLMTKECPMLPSSSTTTSPSRRAVATLREVIDVHSARWGVLRKLASVVDFPLAATENLEPREAELADTLASLSAALPAASSGTKRGIKEFSPTSSKR